MTRHASGSGTAGNQLARQMGTLGGDRKGTPKYQPTSNTLQDRARARADDEASAARTAARAALVATPEYSVESDATGKRLLVPTGAIARGMADYLDESYRRAHSDDEDPR
jgi:hypothetical protein